LQNRPHRCSLEFSLHVVDVMTSILASGETGEYKDILTTCDRPEALGPKAAQDLLA
ncbi:MAG: gfo/Idh/MocA family oxidoreductase, partial [Pseudomonadota bacterium]